MPEYWVARGADETYAGPFPDYDTADRERKHLENRNGTGRYTAYRIKVKAADGV